MSISASFGKAVWVFGRWWGGFVGTGVAYPKVAGENAWSGGEMEGVWEGMVAEEWNCTRKGADPAENRK